MHHDKVTSCTAHQRGDYSEKDDVAALTVLAKFPPLTNGGIFMFLKLKIFFKVPCLESFEHIYNNVTTKLKVIRNISSTLITYG
jgi:hypothetical protein